MRIKQTKSVSRSHIRDDHVVDKGRFSSTSLTNDIDMSKLIFFTNSKSDFLSPIIGIPDQSKLSLRGILWCRNERWIGEFSIYGII